jgi:hypothetical protein
VSKRKPTRRDTPLKEGLIYDRDGWKIWQPVSTVWVISAPGIGVISAMCYPHNQSVFIRAMPLGAEPINFRGAGVREGVIYGIKQSCTAIRKLVDIKKVAKILDDAGIKDDMAGVLSLDTHKKLMSTITHLMDAAYKGGAEAIDRAILDLAAAGR